MFLQKSQQPGWLAIDRQADRIDLAHVKRAVSGRPVVVLCDSYRKEGSDGATLARLRRELKLERYRCTTLLDSGSYQMHQVDAPDVPAAELKDAVRWRLNDLLNYPLESAVIEVLDIPGDRNAPARDRSVYAVTARDSAVGDCVAAFDAAHVPLVAIDIPDLAQRNIAALFEVPQRGVATLAVYADEGILTFTSGGELYLARRIEVSLPQFTATEASHRGQLFERIALEVQRSLDHFDRQYAHVPVAKLLLGPLPQDIGLHEYLAANADVPVETIDLAAVMDFPGVPELSQAARQAQWLRVIGCALRDEEAAAA